MSGWLLDTHIWIWSITGSARLPGAARDLIAKEHARCHLSPISLWETGMLVRKGRIEVAGGFESWCDQALRALPLQDAPLTAAVAREALRIELEHRDPADTFLVATARVYDLKLITVDGRLAGTNAVRTFPVDGETK